MSEYERPTDAAIDEAQAAYKRGEVSLLEATFLADVLSESAPGDLDENPDRVV